MLAQCSRLQSTVCADLQMHLLAQLAVSVQKLGRVARGPSGGSGPALFVSAVVNSTNPFFQVSHLQTTTGSSHVC